MADAVVALVDRDGVAGAGELLGVKLVLVHGSRQQIEAKLKTQKIRSRFEDIESALNPRPLGSQVPSPAGQV